MYHKAFGKIHFIQVCFFSLSTICSIYIIFLWILSDVKEKKIKTALLCLVTCKLKYTGFMQTWTFSSPYSTQILYFLTQYFRKCKATYKRVFFLKQWIILKHTLARAEKKERRERRSRLCSTSPCLLEITFFLQSDCPSVGIFTHVTIKTNKLMK